MENITEQQNQNKIPQKSSAPDPQGSNKPWEHQPQQAPQNDPGEVVEVSRSGRFRSSRRLRHEAEVEVFKRQLGDLETIRIGLGLRPSQICEILKVHPSAWTRWVKEKSAPPHVYQMLEWYVELLSWRGQNNPHGGTPAISKIIRMETPETYLPEKEPLAPLPDNRREKKSWAGNIYIDKKLIVTILVVSFILQCLMLMGVYLTLKH